MSTPASRPARPGRSIPRPASDEGTDPIDYRSPNPSTRPAAPAAPAGQATTTPKAQTPPPSVSGREATVQLGVRVSPEISDLVDAAHRRTGRTRRDLVEDAIRRARWT